MRTMRTLSLAVLASALAVAAAASTAAGRSSDIRFERATIASYTHTVSQAAVSSGQEVTFHVQVQTAVASTDAESRARQPTIIYRTDPFTLVHQLGPGVPDSNAAILTVSAAGKNCFELQSWDGWSNEIQPSDSWRAQSTCSADLLTANSSRPVFLIVDRDHPLLDWVFIYGSVDENHLVTVWSSLLPFHGHPSSLNPGLPEGVTLTLDVQGITDGSHGPDALDPPDMAEADYAAPCTEGMAESRITVGPAPSVASAAPDGLAIQPGNDPGHIIATFAFIYPPDLVVPDYAEYIAAQPVLRYGDGTGTPLEGYDGWTWGLAVYATREQITLENGALWYQSRDPRTPDGSGPRVQVSGANMLGLYGPLTDTNPTLLGYHFTGTFAGPGNIYPVWEQ